MDFKLVISSGTKWAPSPDRDSAVANRGMLFVFVGGARDARW